MKLQRLLGLILLGAAAPALDAEIWHTIRGDTIEGKLTGVYGPLAMIAQKSASTPVMLDALPDSELQRVAEFLATRPPAAPWNRSTSQIAKALKGRLQVLRDGKLVDFAAPERAEPDFYLIYFGANWCPPCHAFSPNLVKAYERLKAIAPGRFEVVFVSSDNSASEQLEYIRHVGMPWPVLKFSHLGRAEVIERWAGHGIPCLVALTREGEALLHSYRGDEYVGPQDVLARFEPLLRSLDGNDPAQKRARHRLAVLQHTHAAAGGNKPLAPYAITMDLRRYQTLETKELQAKLEIDERGCVTDAVIEPELPAVLNHQLVNDASTWLFLPAVEAGRPVRRRAVLPVSIGGK